VGIPRSLHAPPCLCPWLPAGHRCHYCPDGPARRCAEAFAGRDPWRGYPHARGRSATGGLAVITTAAAAGAAAAAQECPISPLVPGRGDAEADGLFAQAEERGSAARGPDAAPAEPHVSPSRHGGVGRFPSGQAVGAAEAGVAPLLQELSLPPALFERRISSPLSGRRRRQRRPSDTEIERGRRRRGRERPRRASSSISAAGAGGRAGRENLRATIGGGDFAARRAKAAAAAAAAVNSAATAVEEATSGTTVSRLPRKSASLIPRKLPGAAPAVSSRLAPPATASASSRISSRSSSIGSSSGVGGRPASAAGAALRTVQVAAEFEEEGDNNSGTDGSSKQGDGAAGGRRSFIPRPSPKEGRSLIPRRTSGRA